MLGYAETDVKKMLASVSFFIGKSNDKDIDEGLLNTIDFLQGIVEEGRV